MTGIWLIRQNCNDIYNGKIPLFLLAVPHSAHLFVIENLYLIFLCHSLKNDGPCFSLQ